MSSRDPFPPHFSTQTLWGNIDLDGTIISGSGLFQTSKQGTGSYVVKFDDPFRDRPAFSVTPGGTASALFLQPFQLTRSKLAFTFLDTQNRATDAAFSFIVIGRVEE